MSSRQQNAVMVPHRRAVISDDWDLHGHARVVVLDGGDSVAVQSACLPKTLPMA